jgi:hypothetical protein
MSLILYLLTTVRYHACTAGQHRDLVALKLRQHPFNLPTYRTKSGIYLPPEPFLVYPMEGSVFHLRVVELEVVSPVMKQNGLRILR